MEQQPSHSGEMNSVLQNRLSDEMEHCENMFNVVFQSLNSFTYNEAFFELDNDKLQRYANIKLGNT